MDAMAPQRITSRKNPLLQRVRALAAHPARREDGIYLCEGRKLLEEALRWQAPLNTVICQEGMELPPLPPQVRLVEVPEDVMASLSPSRSPQGLLFLCTQAPSAPLPQRLEGRRYVLLEGLQDPGNVGTIWRSADALGADGLLLTGGCASPWGWKCLRSSMGACFRLPLWEGAWPEMEALLRRSDLPLYAAALGPESRDLRELRVERCAVAIGNEGAGLSQALLSQCDGRVRIPMRERCESLNAAAAAAVILWELERGARQA